MGLDYTKSEKISQDALHKIMNDHFSDTNFSSTSNSNASKLKIQAHASALCVYAAVLMTKIHETNPDLIIPISNERELEFVSKIKKSSKYTQLSEQQIAEQAHKFLVKDIRNSFAHGNFKINFDESENELYFILEPQRKNFISETPIVISATSLKHAIMSPLYEFSESLLSGGDENIKENLSSNLSELLKGLMLPTQMLKMFDYYSQKGPSRFMHLTLNKKRRPLIEYTLLATKITYEQDDYYNIFGKNSSIFETISLIRNSIAHDNFLFDSQAKSINHLDRNRYINTSLDQYITYLSSANDLKTSILHAQDKKLNKDAIKELKEELIKCFELYFNNTNIQTGLSENKT